MRLSVVCPVLHTWGRCWRKDRELQSEFSQRGWYFVRIVPIHSNHMLILLCCFKCLWKSLCKFHKYCHTLYVTWRYEVFVNDMQGGGTQVCAPGMWGLFHQNMPIPLLSPIKPQILQAPLIGTLDSVTSFHIWLHSWHVSHLTMSPRQSFRVRCT